MTPSAWEGLPDAWRLFIENLLDRGASVDDVLLAQLRAVLASNPLLLPIDPLVTALFAEFLGDEARKIAFLSALVAVANVFIAGRGPVGFSDVDLNA